LRPYRGGDDPYLTRMVCMGYLGGAAGRGNWVGYSNFPTEQTGEYSDKDGKKWDIMSPMTEDGRPFEFIGYFPLFAFIHGDAPQNGHWAAIFKFSMIRKKRLWWARSIGPKVVTFFACVRKASRNAILWFLCFNVATVAFRFAILHLSW